MFEQINNQTLAFGKTYADTFAKAQNLSLQSFERIAGLQMKAFENRMNATIAFWSEASEVRDLDGAKAIWPKGVQLAKDNAETLYATSQEVLGESLKTGEAIGSLVKGTFENTAETITREATTAAKKATR
jgi:hypothetical protein